jgi:hypothetical protein
MNNDSYDVVADALKKYRDQLWQMTEQNLNSELVGLNIMDDIRLQQIAELDSAIKKRFEELKCTKS